MTFRFNSSWVVTAAALLALAGCSSEVPSNGSDQPGDPTANAAPAGTDAVPTAPDAQAAAAPTDPNAPPPVADAGAPPPPVVDPAASPAPVIDPLAANAAPAASPSMVPAAEPLAQTAPAVNAEAAANTAKDMNDMKTSAELASTSTKPASTPAEPAGGAENYTVQNGDTLMKIAFENYGDLFKWRKIYNDNQDRIQDPNHVPPGTVLRLDKSAGSVQISRNGTPYLIKSGDTLGTISDDVYGTKTKWKRLWENNKELIHDPDRIFAGFTLYYEMTPQDRQELEQFHGKPQPLAQSTVDSEREPASKTN